MSSLDISALFGIEPFMYFGVGFCTATLVAVAIAPTFINRAVHLTRRQVMATMPGSLSEARAAQDSARAMFAVAIRKLEIKTEELVGRVSATSAQLGRQIRINERLKDELNKKTDLVTALQTREGAMISRENSLIEELLALRAENRKQRDLLLHVRLPPASSPWKEGL